MRFAAGLLPLFAALMVACAGPPSVVSPSAAAPSEVPPPAIKRTVPTHGVRPGEGPAGIVEGRLALVAGCLRVTSNVDDYVGVWPRGYGLVDDVFGTHLVDIAGATVARIGSMVSVTGGELSRGAFPGAEVRDVPPECATGPFWLVTAIARPSN